MSKISYSFEETLSRVEGFIRWKFASRQSDVDDLVQEALVTVWKRWEDGVRDFTLLRVKGFYKALSMLDDCNWTGQPHRNGPGVVHKTKQGEETRAKIKEYIDSYMRLHNHKPTHVEIGKHLGITPQTVTNHMKRLHLFQDLGPVSFQPIEENARFQDTGGDADPINNIRFGYSFENQLVDRLDTENFLRENLHGDQLEWTTLFVFKGLVYQDIADMYGVHRNTVRNVVRSAIEKMKSQALDNLATV